MLYFKSSLFLFFITNSIIAFSQKRATDNYYYQTYQNKAFYFGFGVDINSSAYRLQQSSDFLGNENTKMVEGKNKGGLGLRFISNLKMGEFFDLRFNPGLSYMNKSFVYNDLQEKTIESVYVDLPFYIRYKSKAYHDKKVFLITGLKYTYDVASNSNARKAETLIRVSPHDFQWEVGVGMQFFYPYFIFSPEIKFGRGLGNLLLYNNSLNESKVLENVVSQVFTLSFNFEG